MPFTFRDGKHIRNPSGCHNKVRWLLTQSHWDIKELQAFIEDFISDEILDREVPVPRMKDKTKNWWFYKWLDAMNIALWICDGKYGRLPIDVFKKYPWMTKYRPMPDDKLFRRSE